MNDLDQFTRTEREFRDALAATRQVVLDLHKALGVEWGGDPYAAIAARDAEVARLRELLVEASSWLGHEGNLALREGITAALAQPKEPT